MFVKRIEKNNNEKHVYKNGEWLLCILEIEYFFFIEYMKPYKIIQLIFPLHQQTKKKGKERKKYLKF